MSKSTYDTLIIGAGMSGLAAGIRLAMYGRRVAILERHTTIGGLNSFYRLDGRNYDVGLHAVTNFTPKGTRKGPLPRLLRQLRFSWEEFQLAPQDRSRIAFPGVELSFANDPALLESQVAERFPDEIDGYRRLVSGLIDYDDLDTPHARQPAADYLAQHLNNPLLADMLLCPICYYGSAWEDGIDFGQFSVMFRSMFLEGLARPHAGVRLLLKLLVRRFRDLGGELRLRTGVTRVLVDRGRAVGVELDDGSQLAADHVLSSAGWPETMALCGDTPPPDQPPAAGRLSFVESISMLDVQPADLGMRDTLVFFNDSPRFEYRRPLGLVDPRSGVICSPNNYVYAADAPPLEGAVRITLLANYDRWRALGGDAYRRAKEEVYGQLAASAVRFIPDFRPHVVATDTFTPTTIERYTGHAGGAVYGSPEKHYDGLTPVENLFLCGTDQGLVGIIGTITSGILIANRYLLRESAPVE